MEAIKTIKAINKSSGEKNGKTWHRFEFEFDDGKKLSTFDTVVGNSLQVGDVVKLEIENDGQYDNLKSIQLHTGPAPKPTSVKDDIGRSIVAQTLTKCWAQTQTQARTAEDVLFAYNYFLEKL